MSTATLQPATDQGRGNLTTQSGGTTNLYTTISEGTASPNDSDYVVSAGGPQTVYFGLGPPPSDVGTVTSVSVAIRCVSSGNKGDIQSINNCRLYKADKSTPLTAQMVVLSTATMTTYTFTPTLSGPATKMDWTGVTLAIVFDIGTVAGAKVSAAQATITYTPSAPSTKPLLRRRRMILEA